MEQSQGRTRLSDQLFSKAARGRVFGNLFGSVSYGGLHALQQPQTFFSEIHRPECVDTLGSRNRCDFFYVATKETR